MNNLLRLDVLGLGLLLAVPVVGLGLKGEFTLEEVAWKVLTCLLVATAVVGIFQAVMRPRQDHAADGDADAPQQVPDVGPDAVLAAATAAAGVPAQRAPWEDTPGKEPWDEDSPARSASAR